MSDLTSEGRRLVATWLTSKDELERAQRKVYDRQRDASEAEEALAKWMLPPDAKPGEKIAVWFVDSLIQVEVGGVVSGDGEGPRCVSSTSVTVRSRGKHHSDLWRCPESRGESRG